MQCLLSYFHSKGSVLKINKEESNPYTSPTLRKNMTENYVIGQLYTGACLEIRSQRNDKTK